MAQRTCPTCGAPMDSRKRYCSRACYPACLIDDCNTPQHAAGLCNRHYTRIRRHGDPDHVVRQPNLGVCSVEGCGQPMRKRTWCASHYASWWRTGDDPRPFEYKWGQGGYSPTHRAISRLRGKASDFPCVDCGIQAEEWSYDGSDRDALTDSEGRTFSRKPEHYDPRCIRCHRKFDNWSQKVRPN